MRFALLDFPRELGVEHQQFGGTLAHPRFQLLMAFPQFRLGVLAGGDVLVDGDEATAGQRLAANLQHCAVRAGALEAVALEFPRQPHPFGDLCLGITGTVLATAGVVAEQFGERQPHPHPFRRKIEQFDEPAVPDLQPQVLVNDTDRFVQVIQTGQRQRAQFGGGQAGWIRPWIVWRFTHALLSTVKPRGGRVVR